MSSSPSPLSSGVTERRRFGQAPTAPGATVAPPTIQRSGSTAGLGPGYTLRGPASLEADEAAAKRLQTATATLLAAVNPTLFSNALGLAAAMQQQQQQQYQQQYQQVTEKKPCSFFKAGTCKFGDRCRNSHDASKADMLEESLALRRGVAFGGGLRSRTGSLSMRDPPTAPSGATSAPPMGAIPSLGAGGGRPMLTLKPRTGSVSDPSLPPGISPGAPSTNTITVTTPTHQRTASPLYASTVKSSMAPTTVVKPPGLGPKPLQSLDTRETKPFVFPPISAAAADTKPSMPRTSALRTSIDLTTESDDATKRPERRITFASITTTKPDAKVDAADSTAVDADGEPAKKSLVDCRYWIAGHECRFDTECRYQHRPERFGTKPEAWSKYGPGHRSQSVGDAVQLAAALQVRRDLASAVAVAELAAIGRRGSLQAPLGGGNLSSLAAAAAQAGVQTRLAALDAAILASAANSLPQKVGGNANGSPCRNWITDARCKWGDECRFRHDPLPNGAGIPGVNPAAAALSQTLAVTTLAQRSASLGNIFSPPNLAIGPGHLSSGLAGGVPGAVLDRRLSTVSAMSANAAERYAGLGKGIKDRTNMGSNWRSRSESLEIDTATAEELGRSETPRLSPSAEEVPPPLAPGFQMPPAAVFRHHRRTQSAASWDEMMEDDAANLNGAVNFNDYTEEQIMEMLGAGVQHRDEL